MIKYKKESPRLTVKFIDGDTEEVLFEIHNRNHLDIGDIFSDGIVTNLITRELGEDNLPENIMVLVVSEFIKTK